MVKSYEVTPKKQVKDIGVHIKDANYDYNGGTDQRNNGNGNGNGKHGASNYGFMHNESDASSNGIVSIAANGVSKCEDEVEGQTYGWGKLRPRCIQWFNK